MLAECKSSQGSWLAGQTPMGLLELGRKHHACNHACMLLPACTTASWSGRLGVPLSCRIEHLLLHADSTVDVPSTAGKV